MGLAHLILGGEHLPGIIIPRQDRFPGSREGNDGCPLPRFSIALGIARTDCDPEFAVCSVRIDPVICEDPIADAMGDHVVGEGVACPLDDFGTTRFRLLGQEVEREFVDRPLARQTLGINHHKLDGFEVVPCNQFDPVAGPISVVLAVGGDRPGHGD